MTPPRHAARAFAVALIAFVALGLAGEAAARTVRLNWVERSPDFGGFVPMTFVVRSVTTTSRGWSVRAEFRNRSRTAVRIVSGDASGPRYGFAVLVYPSYCPRGTMCIPTPLKATYSRPWIPARLRAGQRWIGVFGGRGALPRRRTLAISFGRFLPPGREGFTWVTRSAFRL